MRNVKKHKRVRKLKKEAGDWMKDAPEARAPVPAPSRARGLLVPSQDTYNPESVYDEFRNPTSSPMREAMRAIESGKAVVTDAWIFCGRWDKQGRLLRESDKDTKPYKMLHVQSHGEYVLAMQEAGRQRRNLLRRMEAAAKKRISKAREGDNPQDFQSFTDAGSLMTADPNQFTEYTPMFNGPLQRQQYWDFFKAIARAFEEWNHNPVAKRVVNILAQYALGRGLKVQCKNDKFDDAWNLYARNTNLFHKLRKFWSREYLVNGELMVDRLTTNSIDSSTVYDIITDIENPDNVLYYQQMYQTYTQMYAGIKVPGVPGSEKSIIGKYIIRQIPYDRVIHIKTECFSNEKRGRSVLFSILGWCKRLKDLYNAMVIGEEARANYIFDDCIKGSDADVQAHAARYAYMVPPASIFAHNEAIERKVLAPMQGVSPAKDGIGQEILALIATAVGIPKEHLNLITTGGGSRATAIVSSEPFTKVIEDLQQDFEDLLFDLVEGWCNQQGFDYDEDDWEITFPAVTKDSVSDMIKNWGMANALGAINKRRMSEAIATELEASSYDYEDEVEQDKEDEAAGLKMVASPMPGAGGGPGMPGGVPPGRFGQQPSAPSQDSPLHGPGKQDIIDQHKSL